MVYQSVWKYRNTHVGKKRKVNIMVRYDICVKNMEHYEFNAKDNDEKAKIIALDYFKDDDEYYGSEEAENATIDDCEIWSKEEL